MSGPGPSPLARGEPQISVDEARRRIAAALVPVGEHASVPLWQAAGRVLAVDLISPIDVPAHDNSAMDGFAFDGSRLREGEAVSFEQIATVFAGQPYEGAVPAGACVRIMTGAVMPAGVDTVVPHELSAVEGTRVTVPAGTVQPGENLRRRGEDLSLGGVALHAGRRLRPSDLGLAASLGFAELTVVRRLRVALFSTGDEIVPPGQPLPPGCIYDSNRASLGAALQRLGVEVIDLGVVRDDPQALSEVLGRAVSLADAVVTSGGVSMGDADYTREVLARMGKVDFWKVAMRPGRPFAFGPLDHAGRRAWLFALPGNPVAALVTFHVFAREALLRLAGATAGAPMPVRARCATSIRKRPGRSEFQRAVVFRDDAGRSMVRLTGSQGAGILRSLSEANALLVLAHDSGSVAAGDEVDVWMLDALE